MKKGLAIALSLLLLLGAGAFGYYFLWLSPDGVYNPGRSTAVMEELVNTVPREEWRVLLLENWKESVTPFEDRESVFNGLFESAGELAFRRGEEKHSFVLCTPERELALLRFTYENKQWKLAGVEVLLKGEKHSIRVLVPENAVPVVNGTALDESYITDSALPYEDMTARELAFDAYPVRRVYELSGLYRFPTVEVEGVRLVSQRFSEWSYEPADARSHSISVLAPADATVTVNGLVLGAEDAVGSEGVAVDVSIPEELLGSLPSYTRYRLTRLYTSEKNVQVVCDDGSELLCSEENGTLCYRKSTAQAPEPEIEKLAVDYLGDLCRYGAGQYSFDLPCRHVLRSSELYMWLFRAQGSLNWVRGTGLNIKEVSAGDYLLLNADTCVCSAKARCEIKNYYMTYEAEFAVQLLCQRTPDGWKVTDMAYEA